MKKLVVLLPFAAVLMTTGIAYAADVDSGAISSANPSTGSVTLMDGKTYTVSQPALLRGMAPGDKVNVTINDDKSVGISEDPTQLEGSLSE